MLGRFRTRTGARGAMLVLAFLAVALKIMFPPGFMVGSSLAAPIVICTGQGPAMAMMDGGGHHRHQDVPHQGGDHVCPFAGHGATPLTPNFGVPIVAVQPVAVAVLDTYATVAPGRGMAAPPPPSHAPPIRA